MIVLIVTIFSLFAAGFADDTPPKCNGTFEKWTYCGCQDNGCESLGADQNCTECIEGCFCLPGYVRDFNEVCIDPKKCPPIPECKNQNEGWQRCHIGCEGSCLYPFSRQCDGCVNGCFCLPEYVKHKGKCIYIDDCPVKPICGTNEVWDSCHADCEPTCEEPRVKCTGCVKGCFCKPGYVRNENEQCILPFQCRRKTHSRGK